jgi:hypothetical protein
MEGVKSKNARQRAECLEAMGSIIQDYGKIEIVTVIFFFIDRFDQESPFVLLHRQRVSKRLPNRYLIEIILYGTRR